MSRTMARPHRHTQREEDVQLGVRLDPALRKAVVVAAIKSEMRVRDWIAAAIRERLDAVSGP